MHSIKTKLPEPKKAQLHLKALLDQQEKNRQAAEAFGTTVGTAFGQAATGQIKFRDALRQTAAEVLKLFLKQALGGVIAGAAKTTAPPPVILALAAAGMAGILAMFSKIGSPGGSGGSSSSSLPRTSVERISSASSVQPIQQVDFVIHGNDLLGIVNSQGVRKRQTEGINFYL